MAIIFSQPPIINGKIAAVITENIIFLLNTINYIQKKKRVINDNDAHHTHDEQVSMMTYTVH